MNRLKRSGNTLRRCLLPTRRGTADAHADGLRLLRDRGVVQLHVDGDREQLQPMPAEGPGPVLRGLEAVRAVVELQEAVPRDWEVLTRTQRL